MEAAIRLLVGRKHERLVKSLFRLLDGKQFAETGFEAALLAHIARDDGMLKFEAWQLAGQDCETFYCHALLNSNGDRFTHLDGATMSHTDQEQGRLFYEGTKIKGVGYQKHFRVDGDIPFNLAVQAFEAYLPIEPLSLEYFEVTHSESVNAQPDGAEDTAR